jgi:hypothetical protein
MPCRSAGRTRLDERIASEVAGYIRLLKSRVEAGEGNDYARTRTWKLIQKYTLLWDAMSRPERDGRFEYDALGKAAGGSGVDTWERDHTLRTPEEFAGPNRTLLATSGENEEAGPC